MNSLIESTDIESGIYNIADDDSISTNEIISLIGESANKNVKILNISRAFIIFFANLASKLKLPFNFEALQKLTENYVVSNMKIKNALGVNLPLDTKEGLRHTFASFRKKNFNEKK